MIRPSTLHCLHCRPVLSLLPRRPVLRDFHRALRVVHQRVYPLLFKRHQLPPLISLIARPPQRILLSQGFLITGALSSGGTVRIVPSRRLVPCHSRIVPIHHGHFRRVVVVSARLHAFSLEFGGGHCCGSCRGFGLVDCHSIFDHSVIVVDIKRLRVLSRRQVPSIIDYFLILFRSIHFDR
jgi:hypothetical protein